MKRQCINALRLIVPMTLLDFAASPVVSPPIYNALLFYPTAGDQSKAAGNMAIRASEYLSQQYVSTISKHSGQ